VAVVGCWINSGCTLGESCRRQVHCVEFHWARDERVSRSRLNAEGSRLKAKGRSKIQEAGNYRGSLLVDCDSSLLYIKKAEHLNLEDAMLGFFFSRALYVSLLLLFRCCWFWCRWCFLLSWFWCCWCFLLSWFWCCRCFLLSRFRLFWFFGFLTANECKREC
jgi:hypothetical protein